MQDVRDVYAVIRDAAILLSHVGAEYAPVFVRASNHYKDKQEEADFTVSDSDTAFTHAVEDALLRTLNILSAARVGSLLDGMIPYWAQVPELWARRRVRLNDVWDPLVLVAYDIASDTSEDSLPEFVVVHAEPANEKFVDALHYISRFEPNLRLMFIEAEDPHTVYTANILDEDAVSSILNGYPHTQWKGEISLGPEHEQYTVEEFRVYKLGGYRIFRSGGYLAACSRSALEALKSGEFLPRMASIKTGSVIRVTFSQRAMTDHAFRDFLRGLGGVQASPSSWDIPIYEENDVEQTLDKIKHTFGYPVNIYQIVDHPKHDIYAFAEPESQVVRMLSAEVLGIETDIDVVVPALDINVEAALEVLEGPHRHTLEKIVAASKIRGYYVVTCPGEVKPRVGRACDDVQSMFACTRTDVPAAEVVIIPGKIAKIVNADIIIHTEQVVINDSDSEAVEPTVTEDEVKFAPPVDLIQEDTIESPGLSMLPMVASVKMEKKTRSKINEALGAAGFDGSKAFDSVSSALGDAQAILWDHKFQTQTQVNEALGVSGHKTFLVFEKGEEGEEVSNTILAFQWAPKGDTNSVEVIAYLG